MKFRIISLVLALLLLISLVPAPVFAAATEAAEIQTQIRNTYRKALWNSGKSSFNGFCGSLVNWQTKLLGIDTRVYGCDGKNEYDMYRDMGTTTGGYRVKCYDSAQYDLLSALNAITNNGTTDAYNILVGFERTNTAEGSIYGHALLIHAILDGMVYFVECYTASIDDKYWAEGAPICVSIEAFCDYYNKWTVFDGIAHFGLKTYADVCTVYPCNQFVMVTENTPLYTSPYEDGTVEAKKTGKSLVIGERVRVSAILQTPGGSSWYQVSENGKSGYIKADKTAFISCSWDDIAVADLKVPGAVRRGAGFNLSGRVAGKSSQILNMQVVVYAADADVSQPLLSATIDTNSKSVSLRDGRLDKALTFRNLPVGSYKIAITVTAEQNILKDGVMAVHTTVMPVWVSQFEIVTGWERYVNVTLDAGGICAGLNRKTLAVGSCLGELPVGQFAGGTVTGWALDPEGTMPVTEDTVIEKDVTLYAQWNTPANKRNGWYQDSKGWHYYIKGTLPQGLIVCNGVYFYQNSDGTLFKGWMELDGKQLYFNTFGAMAIGWQEIQSNRYYFDSDGNKQVGWITLDDGTYYLNENGKMMTHWLEHNGNFYYLGSSGRRITTSGIIDGLMCHFDSNGILQYAQKIRGDAECYVIYDRKTAEQYVATAKRVLFA